MKKLLLFVLLALLSIAVLTACGSDDNDNDAQVSDPVVNEPDVAAGNDEPVVVTPVEPEPVELASVTDGARVTLVNEVTTLVLNNRVERLLAERATINNAAFNGERVGNFAEDGSISWYVNIFFNGLYRVSLEYARHEGGESAFVIDGASEPFSATLPGTGGNLQTTAVGYIVLMSESDPYQITLRPTEFYNGEFAEFTAVILEWVEDIEIHTEYVTIEGGTTRLLHTQAELAYGEIRDEGGNLGFWCGSSVASWPINVRQEGNYIVRIYTTSYTGLGGVGRLTSVFDRVETLIDVPYTGGWGNYQWVEVATIGLREGEYRLRLQGHELRGGHFMNLRYVELEYVGEFAPVFPVREDDVVVSVATAVMVGEEGPRPENYWYNIGHFRRDYAVDYHLNIFEAGEFEVILRHSGNYGGAGSLHIGDSVTDIDVPHSGGWGTFIETSLGVHAFPEGEITVRVAGGPGEGMDWFMNHSNIRLVRQ